MGILKLQIQTSLDGMVSGPSGEMDWLGTEWDAELNAYVDTLTQSVRGILLGRTLAEGFIPHWAGVAADPANPEQSSGRFFTDTPKFVYSRTLTGSPWANTTLLQGDLAEGVAALKRQHDGDLIVYGGVTLVSALLAHGLIDELCLFVNPVALGRGRSIFGAGGAPRPLSLQDARAFACGIVLLRYTAA
jgi:dihydrofolate reductase